MKRLRQTVGWAGWIFAVSFCLRACGAPGKTAFNQQYLLDTLLIWAATSAAIALVAFLIWCIND